MPHISAISTSNNLPADQQDRELAASEIADVSGGFFGAFVVVALILACFWP